MRKLVAQLWEYKAVIAICLVVLLIGVGIATGALKGDPRNGASDAYNAGYGCGQGTITTAANDPNAMADPVATLDAIIAACRHMAADLGLSFAQGSDFRNGFEDGYANGPSSADGG